MDADVEDRIARRLREELSEAFPDDAAPPPLPAAAPRWSRHLVPWVAAAAVAALAVGIVAVTGPHQSPSVATTPSGPSSDLTSAPSDPNVFWEPMPDDAQKRAGRLAQSWNGSGFATSDGTRDPEDGPYLFSASVQEPDLLVLHGIDAEPGTGPCQAQYVLSVWETNDAVVVRVRSRPGSPVPPVTSSGGQEMEAVCLALGYPVDLPVRLAAPLGERAVLYFNRWEDVPLVDQECHQARGMLCVAPSRDGG